MANPLRVVALPRVGELHIIAYYRAERPRVPAAAAERRAALYNADLSVHPGGGLQLMGALRALWVGVVGVCQRLGARP